jgi:hypothetical protein
VCLVTSPPQAAVLSWEFSHNQEGKTMTHEEKVLYLFKLSVETSVAYKTASIGRSSTTLEETIENVYAKYERLLDEKLKSESGH